LDITRFAQNCDSIKRNAFKANKQGCFRIKLYGRFKNKFGGYTATS